MNKLLLFPVLAMSAIAADATVIVDTPEGTLYNNVYVDNDYSFLIFNGVAGYTETEGGCTQIVVNETEGKIYLHNVIEFYPEMNAWIEGSLAEDGTATFAMPQEIYVNASTGSTYTVDMLVPEVNAGAVTFVSNTEAPDLIMTWNGESLVQVMPDQQMPTGYDRYLGYIGVVSSGTDMPFYGQSGLHYYVYPDPVDIPRGLELEATEYTLTFQDQWNDSYTELAVIYRDKNGDGVWIEGLNWEAPEQVVKATEDAEGNLVLTSNQFTGYTQGAFTFFFGCDIYRNDKHILVAEWTDDVVLKLVDGKYEAQGSMMFNVGDREPKLGLGLKGVVLTPQEDKDYTPANPVIEGPEDDGTEIAYEEGMSFYILSFYLDAVSDEGEAINSADLYYSVYVNGEQVPVGMDEEMMEVPFGYNNDVDVYSIGSWNMVVGIWFGEIETLGVQAIYKNKSGEETKSELVTYVNPETGVANVSAGSEILATEYFDLTGRRVAEPAGLCIRRITRADGSVETVKTFIRK